jgi:hypothetical protein
MSEKLDFMFPKEHGERGRLEYVNILSEHIQTVKSAVRANLSWDEYKEWCAHQAEKDQEEARKQDLLIVKRKHDPSDAQPAKGR